MTDTLSATEKHGLLVDAGWRCQLDGRISTGGQVWRSPDRADQTRYSFHGAWTRHLMARPDGCLCDARGYCADTRGDPLACPACVKLGPGDYCPGIGPHRHERPGTGGAA